MDDPARFLIWLSVFAYGLAVAHAAWRLGHAQRHSRSITYPLIAAGFLLQTTGLYLRGLEFGACPLGNPFEVIQFVLWSTIFLFLIIGPVFHLNLLGSFSAALVSVISLISLLVPAWDRPHETVLFGGDPLIEFHAAVSIFGYGIFGLLSVTSVMYCFQYASLNHKKGGRICTFLPSIVQLDVLSSRLLNAGLLVLTLAFLSGVVVWFDGAWDSLRLKLAVVFLLWVGYGIVWILRNGGRISPRKSAVTFLFLFLFALASLWSLQTDRNQNAEDRSPGIHTSVPSTPEE